MKKSDILNKIFRTLESRESLNHLENLFGFEDTNNFIDWFYDFSTIRKLDFTNFPVEIYVAEGNILGMIEDIYTWWVFDCYNVEDVEAQLSKFQ